MTEPAQHDAPGLAAQLVRLLRAFEHAGVARRMRLGLNANEEAVLLMLAGGVHAPTEICQAIGMTTAGMTNLVDRLEAAGLVRRTPHRTDKRRVFLVLTKKGFAAHLQLEALADTIAAATTSGMPVEEFLDIAAEGLERLGTEEPL